MWRDGNAVSLSPTEFKLLRYFMTNAGRVLSKAQILDHVWDYDFGVRSAIVESYVSVLRRKIDNRNPRLIHTLRGVGYVCGCRRSRDARPAAAGQAHRRDAGAARRRARPSSASAASPCCTAT